MSLFQRFENLAKAHKSVKDIGADPFAIRIDRVLSPTEAMIGRKKILLAGTNNYLGLTFDAVASVLRLRRWRLKAQVRPGHRSPTVCMVVIGH